MTTATGHRPSSFMCALIDVPLLAAVLAAPVQAALVADSIADFSGVQGGGGWSYGFFNRTADADDSYQATDFTPFALFNGTSWKASEGPGGQLGANNTQFLNINALGGHPTGIGPADPQFGAQDAIIWAMRRYVSEVDGPITLAYDLHKLNTNPAGGGITGRIFVDGLEVFTQFLAAADGVGFVDTLALNVGIGTVIDFAIDPTGVVNGGDNAASARADGSQFSARITTRENGLPAPASAWLAAAGLAVMLARRRRMRGG